MSWWSSVALPALSRTVDPTGTLAKAVNRASTASSTGNRTEVARAFLDPLNVTKYVAKKPVSSSSTSGSSGVTGGVEQPKAITEVAGFLQQYWLIIVGGLLVLLLLKRR